MMTEKAVDGLGSLIPPALQAFLLRPRNVESVSRLGDLAVGRTPRSPGTGSVAS
jgi:hypothetical protein